MNAGLQLNEAVLWTSRCLGALNATKVLQQLVKTQISLLLTKAMLINQANVKIECIPDRMNSPHFNAIAICQFHVKRFPEITYKMKLDLGFFLRKSQLYQLVYSLTTTSDIRELGVSS